MASVQSGIQPFLSALSLSSFDPFVWDSKATFSFPARCPWAHVLQAARGQHSPFVLSPGRAVSPGNDCIPGMSAFSVCVCVCVLHAVFLSLWTGSLQDLRWLLRIPSPFASLQNVTTGIKLKCHNFHFQLFLSAGSAFYGVRL